MTNPWQKIQLARHPRRPQSLDYINIIFEEFQELHGDRNFKDDRSIICGIGSLNKKSIAIIGQQKGRTTKEKLIHNFGCPYPEGYRKALRIMKIAEKFHLPILSFVDTPGAYPGVASEERHVAETIAVNIREMSQIKVPIIAVIIGEGGSGGALGISLADHIIMLENSYYSVISPEGCAAILWKNRSFAPEATKALKITSKELLKFKIIDSIIDEPNGGAHISKNLVAESIKNLFLSELDKLNKMTINNLIECRYKKYRSIGSFN